MVDKDDFVKYEQGKERRVDLALTLQGIEFHLRTLNNRQGVCDDDRAATRAKTEQTEKQIANHLTIHKAQEKQCHYTFDKITTIVAIIVAALAVILTKLF